MQCHYTPLTYRQSFGKVRARVGQWSKTRFERDLLWPTNVRQSWHTLDPQEFYEVLATYSWGDEYMVSHKDFKGVWYDIELWPRKMVQDHCSTFTQMHSLDGALNRIDLRERVYGSDKELHTSCYDPLT